MIQILSCSSSECTVHFECKQRNDNDNFSPVLAENAAFFIIRGCLAGRYLAWIIFRNTSCPSLACLYSLARHSLQSRDRRPIFPFFAGRLPANGEAIKTLCGKERDEEVIRGRARVLFLPLCRFCSSLMSRTRPQSWMRRPRVPSSTSALSLFIWGKLTLSPFVAVLPPGSGVENIAWLLDLGERREEVVVRRGEGGEEKM